MSAANTTSRRHNQDFSTDESKNQEIFSNNHHYSGQLKSQTGNTKITMPVELNDYNTTFALHHDL
jgi:hypothetical protein